jgi:hypothetical protein
MGGSVRLDKTVTSRRLAHLAGREGLVGVVDDLRHEQVLEHVLPIATS